MSLKKSFAVAFFLSIATAANADPLYVKVRFSIEEHSNFAGQVFTTLGTPEVAVAITAGCAAFGVDCSAAATGLTTLTHNLGPNDNKNGQDHHGIYRAPVGYEICKAKVDWAHTGIDGGSTFNTRIVREPNNNGLGYYAVVPTGGGRGHGINSDLYLEFVPAGQ